MNWKRIGVLSWLILSACGSQTPRDANAVPVKISVNFENTMASQTSQTNPYQLLTNGSMGVVTHAVSPTPTATATPTAVDATSSSTTSATATTGTTVTIVNSPEDVTRFLIPPEKLIADAANLFQYKRAFRWLNFKIMRGPELLKQGSVEIEKPDIMDVSPIELDARQGDVLSVALSFFQVDFMNDKEGDSFCRRGGPGFVRTWAGETNYTVNADGNVQIDLRNAGVSTLHMAVLAFNEEDAKALVNSEARHGLVDRLTGQRYDKQLCPVIDLPATGLSPGRRYLKSMAFSKPLKTHAFEIFSPSFKARLMPSETPDPTVLPYDQRATAELGITLGAFAMKSSEGVFDAMRKIPSDLMGSAWMSTMANTTNSGSGDTTPPSISILSPVNGSFVPASFLISGLCELGASTVQLFGDSLNLQTDCVDTSGSAGSTMGSYSLTVPSLSGTSGAAGAAGTSTTSNRSFKIYQSDAAGNGSSVVVSYVQDNTPPSVTVGTSVSAIRSGSTGATFTIFAYDDLGSGVNSVNLDLVTFTPVALASTCTKSIDTANKKVTLSGCTGNGTLSANLLAGVATDAVGNTSIAVTGAAAIAVDNTGPTLSVSAPLASQWIPMSGFFTLSANCEVGGSNVTVSHAELENSYSVTCPASGTLSQTLSFKSTTATGTYNLTLNQGDSLGNQTTLTYPVKLDRTPPSLLAPPGSTLNVNNTSKTFSWTATDAGSGIGSHDPSTINISNYSAGSGASCTLSKSSSLDSSTSAATITLVINCTGNGTADLLIPAGVVKDVVLNQSAAQTIPLNIDNTPPSVSFNLATTTFTSPTGSSAISGTCTVGDGLVTLMGDLTTQTTTCSSVSGALGSFSFTGFTLNSGTSSKLITVKQTDATGNVGQQTKTLPQFPSLNTATPTTGNSDSLRAMYEGNCQSGADFTTSTSMTGSSSGRVIMTACHSSTLNVALAFPFISSAQTVTIQVTTTHTPSGLSSRSDFSIARSARVCPLGYVPVRIETTYPNGLGNTNSTANNLKTWLDTQQDFCVMKTPAKRDQDGSGTSIAKPSALFPAQFPWTNISRDEAAKKCDDLNCSTWSENCSDSLTYTPLGSTQVQKQNEFRGYRLISNLQWQIIGRKVEMVPNNWIAGAVNTSSGLYRGHSDGAPAAVLSHSATDSDGFFGTNESTGAQKRTKQISTSSTDIIWDFGGNINQWVTDEYSSTGLGVGLATPLSSTWQHFIYYFVSGNWVDNIDKIFGPSTNYSSTSNIGQIRSPTSSTPSAGVSRAVVRSGQFNDADIAGLYTTKLDFYSNTSDPNTGFRCVYIP